MLKKLIIIVIVLFIASAVYWSWINYNEMALAEQSFVLPKGGALEQTKKGLAAPLSRAQERVTKKPFGLKVSPKNSPVQPEKFFGYHTGTDFETFPEEKGTAVAIYAICEGKLLSKKKAAGYGGVAIQSCLIDGRAVTVVYGHLTLSSIKQKVGAKLASGEQIAILGESGPETDGERKHLHLGVHKGAALDIRGYVQSQKELSSWLDWQKI